MFIKIILWSFSSFIAGIIFWATFLPIYRKYKFRSFVYPICILIFVITTYFILYPKYNLTISGKLYIVNKGSRSLSVFDLKRGKTLKTIKYQKEAHEATLLSDKKRLIIANNLHLQFYNFGLKSADSAFNLDF